MKKGKLSKQRTHFFELEKSPKSGKPEIEQNVDDFEQIVEKGKVIKDRIRKLCEDRFTPEQKRRDNEFEKSIISAASFTGKHIDLYDSAELNPTTSFELDPKDSHTSRNIEVSVFPVAEQKLFPPRRPQTGWEIGLRNYEEIEEKKKKRTVSEAAKSSIFTTQGDKANDEVSSLKGKKTSLLNISLTEMKKAQYATRNLPKLTTDVVERYFEEKSVEKFHNTYKQLQDQGKIINGGYETLNEIIKDTEINNVLTVARRELEQSGVITPREELAPKRNATTKEKPRPKSSSAALSSSVAHKRSISSSALISNTSLIDKGKVLLASNPKRISTQEAIPAIRKNSSQLNEKEQSPRLKSTGKSHSVGWIKASSLEDDDDDNGDMLTAHSPLISPTASHLLPQSARTSATTTEPFKFLSSKSSSTSSVHTFHTLVTSQPKPQNLPDVKSAPSTQNNSITIDDKVGSSVSSRLDDHSYVDKGADLEYEPGSPRAVFLAGCLKNGLPPRAHVLLRKRISTSINLSHIGIGNEMAKILAEALPSLPYLQTINLSDNNLEDDGLSAIIKAIAEHPTIEIVDISQNIIGSEAANALANFVGNPECQLQCLRLSDANIDDGECASFVEVLMNNRHLKELDLSKNLLGKDENLNTVQPDFTTGGEALSELLKQGLCPIQSLNLHWNMIRLEGAEVLCNSIRSNSHLMTLDLSYNALGSSAACILGSSLMENKTLQILNIANNGIDMIGCFTLFVGLRQNKSLREINIDGNPIGEQGARILMKTVAYEGHRLKISSNNCDFNIKSGSKSKFELQSPFGEYFLDLTQPYDRAILLELVDIAANDPNVQINSLEYSETVAARPLVRPGSATPNNSRPQSAKGGASSRPQSASPAGKGSAMAAVAAAYDKPKIGGFIYRIVRFHEHTEDLSENEKKELEFLSSFQKAIDMTSTEFFELVKRFDTEGRGSISVLCIKRILQELQIQQVNRVMHEIKFTIDPSGSGYYGVDEFVEYFVERCKIVKIRIKHMKSKPHCAIYRPVNTKASFVMTPYIPPTSGSVYVKVIESYDVSSDDKEVTSPLTDSQCKQLIKTAKESSNPLQLMLFGIESFQLHLEEAQLLIKEIGSRSDDPILALSKILLRMKSYYSAMRLMHCYTHNDIVKIRRLKQRLGNAYNPLVGLYSGYYVLDLSNENDRLCLKKLIEKSVKNIDFRRKSGLWDTSQHGHWSCFRNEYHYWNYGSGEARESIMISPKYFFPVPHRGKLEFDFVNIERPDPSVNRPADHDRIVDCLLMSGLLEEDYIKDIVCKINDLNMVSRRSILSTGNPYWRTSVARSLAIGEHIYNMYSSLNRRYESKKKALKRELIKNLAPEKPKADKRNRGDGKVRPSGFYSSSASVKKTSQSNHNEVQYASNGQVSLATESITTPASVELPKDTTAVDMKTLTVDAKVLNRVKKVASAFRSLVFRSRAESVGKSWGKRLHEVMEANSSDEYKCAAVLEYFETELTSLWLYCVQISVILELFAPIGLTNRSSMGSYRVELVIMLFDRILDLYNFEFILMVLNAEEQAALYARLGILNLFNPCKPEAGYSFDLHRWEERQVTKILIHLSVVEPGENWLNKEFCFDRGFLPMPGWDLNLTWLHEDGLPKKGLLSFEMFAGDGMRQLGCCVDSKLRLMLTSLVLVSQRNFVSEIKRGDLLTEEKMFNYERGNKYPLNFFPNMTTKTQPVSGNGSTNGPTKRIKKHVTRTILPLERDDLPDSAAPSDTEYERGDLTGTHTPAELVNHNHDYKPLLPLLKLYTQMDILAQFNTPTSAADSPPVSSSPTFYAFTYEDCNRHLSGDTDITWNYTSGNQKYESWTMK